MIRFVISVRKRRKKNIFKFQIDDDSIHFYIHIACFFSRLMIVYDNFVFFFNFFRFFLNIHTLITGVCCLWASTGLPFFPTFIIFIMIIFGGNLFGQKKIYLSCLAHTHWMMGPIYTFTHTVSYLNKIFNLKFNKKKKKINASR